MPRGEKLDSISHALEALRARIPDPSTADAREEWPHMVALLDELLQELRRERQETQRRLARLARNQADLDGRLLPLEYSRVFRMLRWFGESAARWKTRAGHTLLHSRLHPLYLRVFSPRHQDAYQSWLELERVAIPDMAWHVQEAQRFVQRPLISIILPVHDPPRAWLEEAVRSVLDQSYGSWELCVCDDASSQPWVEEYFCTQAAADKRIRFVRSSVPLGIAAASNRAGELASGDYVGFLDQDDALSPVALHYVVSELQQHDPVLIFSDEDQIDVAGRRCTPVFKPGWDPELLTGCMYMGHFLVARRADLDRVNWLRSDFDGSQDYDLALRLTEGSGSVRHVPRILYHWRSHEGSTCGDPAAKPYAHAAGRRAVDAALRRRNWKASVENGPLPGTFRLRRQVSPGLSASLVICSRNPKLLRRCLETINRRTDYPLREIVVVQHRSGNTAAMDRLLRGKTWTVVPYQGPFDFSTMNNLGAGAAHGDVLVFLNDDVEPLTPDWLTALVAQAQRPEVGVVGARLLYPSGAVQHVGIAVGIMDGAGHPKRGCFETPYWNWDRLARNVSAVTGACLAIRRLVFDQLGRFDPGFPHNYNDVDLCLRARRAGYSVICEPAAVLRHHEAQTRRATTRYQERERLFERWGDELDAGDPFYSPNLTTAAENASLRMDHGAGL